MGWVRVGAVDTVGGWHGGGGHRGGHRVRGGGGGFWPAYGYGFPYIPVIPSRRRRTQDELDDMEADLDEKEERLRNIQARRRALAEHSEGIVGALGR